MSKKYVEFFLGGDKVDLEDNTKFPIALTFTVDVLGEIGRRAGGYSKSFDIPATKRNNRKFEQSFDPTVIGNEAEKLQQVATFIVNGLEVMRGKGRLLRSAGQRAVKTYSVQIVGDNLDWRNEISDRELVELDFSSSDHNFTYANLSFAWSNFPASLDYTYPLINYGEWKSGSLVETEDFKAALSVKVTLDKIFADTSYKLTSAFFDSPFFEKLIWLSGQFRLGPDDLEFYSCEAEMSIDQAGPTIPFIGATFQQLTLLNFDNEISDPSNINRPDGFAPGVSNIVPPGAGLGTRIEVFVRVRIVIELLIWDPALLGSSGTIGMFNGVTLGSYDQQLIWNAPGPGTFTFDYEVGPFIIDTALPPEDQLIVSVITFQIAAAQHHNIKAGSKIFVRPTEKIQVGTFFNLAQGAIKPGIKQIDFIRGLTHLFNLYWKTDALGLEVFCEPREDYFDDTAPLDDFEQILDLSKGVVVSNFDKIKRRLRLSYLSDDKDNHVKEKEDIAQSRIYDTVFKFTDRAKEGETPSENPFFAGTDNIYDDNIRALTLAQNPNPPAIPRIWNDEWDFVGPYPEKGNDFAPRILIYGGKTSGRGAAWRSRDDSGAIIEQSGWPKAYTVDYNDEFGVSPSLAYGDVLVHGNIIRGRVFFHYLQQLSSLSRGAIFTGSFLYSLNRIFELDLQRFVQLRATHWQIIEITDFNPVIPASTKTTLLQIVDPLQEDEDALTPSEISGVDELEF